MRITKKLLNYSFSIPNSGSFLDDFLNKRGLLHKKIVCFEIDKYTTLEEASNYLLFNNDNTACNTASVLLSLEVKKNRENTKTF